MDLKNLNQTDAGKFFYNVLIGIVASLIMEFGTSLTNNVLIPFCMPETQEMVIKLKNKKNKVLFGRFLVSMVRLAVISVLLIILLNRFSQIKAIKL